MAESVEIQFTGSSEGDTKTRSVSVIPDGKTSLLDAARLAGVEITATCGARGRCRSCRVKILKGDVPPASVQDVIQLGTEEVREQFRLSCQTRIIADCSVVPVPPISEGGHQILESGIESVSGQLSLDCGVEKHHIRANAPIEEHHQTSDLEEILQQLEGDSEVEISADALRKIAQALREKHGDMTVTTFSNRVIDVEVGDTTDHAYGMAFDIGTTSIVGTLMDLKSGEQLATVGKVNPQSIYGGDLMSRIAYAQYDQKRLTTLRAKVLNAISEFIKEACKEAKISSAHIYKLVIVGNTCMHHIFLGIDTTYVGLAPYAPVVRRPLVFSALELPLKGAANAQICFLPIIAGFVGADTIACMLATRIYDRDEICAFVDIGTNAEVVMGNKDGLMACSAPAGPALEGGQIRHGMRGALGAIEKVTLDDTLHCQVIGNVPPIGVCGSGLIDACAVMLDSGVLQASGSFQEDLATLDSKIAQRVTTVKKKEQFILARAEESGKDDDIAITQSDVRQLQLAKGAIYSGIVMLMHVLKLEESDVSELMLSGGFGNYINIDNAKRIRMLPSLPTEKITYVGNAALLGAQMALLSETERDRAAVLAKNVEHIALATHPKFQELFVDAITFEGSDKDYSFSFGDDEATTGSSTAAVVAAREQSSAQVEQDNSAVKTGSSRRRKRKFRGLGGAE